MAKDRYFRTTLLFFAFIALIEVALFLLFLFNKEKKKEQEKEEKVEEYRAITPANLTNNENLKEKAPALPSQKEVSTPILKIIALDHRQGNKGEEILNIGIKSLLKENLNVSDVKVCIYFYDNINGEILPSKAPVISRWLNSPVTWQENIPEILEVIYQPLSEKRTYAGYIVALYYQGKLQHYRADPLSLLDQYPIKVYLTQEPVPLSLEEGEE